MSSLTPEDEREFHLLSDEPTIELVLRAREGDRQAVEALLQRCIPQLKRWAHGKLPSAARNTLDTNDLVQETVLHVLRRLDSFQPRHVGAMQAYLRQSVLNRIRDELRRIGRHPASCELPDDMASDEPSPLEHAVKAEAVSRYYDGLAGLSPRDRQVIDQRQRVGTAHSGLPLQRAQRSGTAREQPDLTVAQRAEALHEPWIRCNARRES